MAFDYFYGDQSDLFAFYRVPKRLFTDSRFHNLSTESKTLYGILLDRMSLSAKNGWLDEDGRVYIIFTVQEIRESLSCGNKKAISLLDELENKVNLIERKRQGLGKPNLIYVKNFCSADFLVERNFLKCQNDISVDVKTTPADVSKAHSIDEFHLLLKEEQTATYSVEIWKRFRKWGGIPTGITQNVKDLLRSPEIANILENSDFIYMLNQASGDRSILAQRLNISPHQLSYVTNSGEGEGLLFYLHLADTYVDNGWTGTNTNRPEFQRMLADIHAGKIRALVIKDFSRFSRDYIEAGNLLENVFPFLGVRFISVADSYDSFETDGSTESLLIPLKNLINSFYSKDMSKKVSTAVHTRQLAGQHIPSMIPYGYKKSETQAYRFEPDEETAANVTRIFRMKLAGVPTNQIAKTMNDEGIPSPGKLRYLRGMTKDQRYATSHWTPQLIKQILKNPTYCGDLVFGRMPTALYLGKPNYSYEPDESKWRVLSDMHQPLIDRESFEKVKQMENAGKQKFAQKMQETAEHRAANPPLILGLVYCGDCSSPMRYHRHKNSTKPTGSYYCPHKSYGTCNSSHTISQTKLIEVAWNVLQDQMRYFCSFERLLQKLKQDDVITNRQSALKNEIQSVLVKIGGRQSKRERLYEDFTDGILSPEEYMQMKERYDQEYQSLNAQLNQLQHEQAKLNKALSGDNHWMIHMQKLQNTTTPDPELMKVLIDKIFVYEHEKTKRIEVRLNYQEEFHILQAAYEEVMGGACQ